ncbi:MAG: hypothetical protein KBA71_08375 [Opitutaceae bacterium]|nr:hypothetical protein [Opitutaceae bacterium]
MRFFTLLFLFGCLAAYGQSSSPARIVAFGDSTTAPRASLTVYPALLEKELSARLAVPCQIVNAGIPGNTTAMARQRFEADVLAVRPALVIIQFGINDSAFDVWKSPPATTPRVTVEDYRRNLRHFVEASRATGAAVILMTPNPLRWTPAMQKKYGKPPYDPARSDGFNLTLVAYVDAMRALAKEMNVPLLDVAKVYAALPCQSVDALLPDGMHPSQRGHDLVAQLLADVILGTPELAVCLK